MDSLLVLKIIKFIGAVMVVMGACYSLIVRNAPDDKKRIILLAWMIGPPVFFYVEYYLQAPLLSESELIRFKDLQGLASAIWAGVAGALAVTYFKKS